MGIHLTGASRHPFARAACLREGPRYVEKAPTASEAQYGVNARRPFGPRVWADATSIHKRRACLPVSRFRGSM